jgi:hypothetical protein
MLLKQSLLPSGKKIKLIKFPVFWDMMPCGLVYRYESFGAGIYFHIQDNIKRGFPKRFYDKALGRGRLESTANPL